MIKKRKDWIDISKGICSLFIVLLHIDSLFWNSNAIGEYLNKYICIFKVSLFFCISGLTLKEEKLSNTKKYIADKFSKLYFKMIIIGLAFVFLHNWFIDIGFYNTDLLYSGKSMYYYDIWNLLKELFLTLILANREVIIGPLWFGYVLFLSLIVEALLFSIINKLNFKAKRELRLIICFLLMTISWIIGVWIKNIPRVNNTFSALFLIDYTQYLFHYKKIGFSNLKFFLLMLAFSFVLPFLGTFQMNRNMIVNPVFFVLAASVFMYVIFFLSKCIEKIPHMILQLIGMYSFEIMAFQFLGFKIALLIVNADTGLLVPFADNIIYLLYYMAFGLVIPVIIGLLVKYIKMFVRKIISGKD